MRFKFLRGPHTGEIMQQAPSADLKRSEMLGDIEILPEPKPEPRPRGSATWKIAFSASLENYFYASCSACGQSSRLFNPSARASFAHCGKVEIVPDDVYRDYKDRLEKPESEEVAALRRNTTGTVHFV